MSRISAPRPVPRMTPSSGFQSPLARICPTASLSARWRSFMLRAPYVPDLEGRRPEGVGFERLPVLVQERFHLANEAPLAALEIGDALLERRAAPLGLGQNLVCLEARLLPDQLSVASRSVACFVCEPLSRDHRVL